MATSKKPAPKPPKFTGFTPGLIQFLGDLSLNNDRDWFKANSPRYEQHVREPALAFIRAISPKLAKISRHFTAIDKKVGGSLMRIHRDVRFSKEKTPYKTNLGIQFRHEVGKDAHAPGFYLHVDTESIFVAAGTWHPDAETLASIRQRIAEHGPAWKRARDNAKFVAHYALEGESLTRPPRGFAKDHPFIDDLRRKDHIAVCRLSVDELLGPKAADLVASRFAVAKPYVAFLCKSIDLAV
jgi:uncharacterized protein (TIGR02453 family)